MVEGHRYRLPVVKKLADKPINKIRENNIVGWQDRLAILPSIILSYPLMGPLPRKAYCRLVDQYRPIVSDIVLEPAEGFVEEITTNDRINYLGKVEIDSAASSILQLIDERGKIHSSEIELGDKLKPNFKQLLSGEFSGDYYNKLCDSLYEDLIRYGQLRESVASLDRNIESLAKTILESVKI